MSILITGGVGYFRSHMAYAALDRGGDVAVFDDLSVGVRIVAEDTPKNLAAGLQGVERLEVEVGGPAAEVLPVLKGIKGVNDVTHVNEDGRHTYTIQAQAGKDLRDEISQAVISNGWSLRGLQMVGMSLEEIFLRLTTHEEL